MENSIPETQQEPQAMTEQGEQAEVSETEQQILENLSGAAFGSICAYIREFGSPYQTQHISQIIEQLLEQEQQSSNNNSNNPDWNVLRQRAYELAGDWLWMHATNHFRVKIAPQMQIPHVLLDTVLSVKKLEDGYGFFRILPPEEVLKDSTEKSTKNSSGQVLNWNEYHVAGTDSYFEQEDTLDGGTNDDDRVKKKQKTVAIVEHPQANPSAHTNATQESHSEQLPSTEKATTTQQVSAQMHPSIDILSSTEQAISEQTNTEKKNLEQPKDHDKPVHTNNEYTIPETTTLSAMPTEEKKPEVETIFHLIKSSSLEISSIAKFISNAKEPWIPTLFYLLFLFPTSNEASSTLLQQICQLSCIVLQNLTNQKESIITLISICKYNDADNNCTDLLSSLYLLSKLLYSLVPSGLHEFILTRIPAEIQQRTREDYENLLSKFHNESQLQMIMQPWIIKFVKKDEVLHLAHQDVVNKYFTKENTYFSFQQFVDWVRQASS